MYFPSLGRSLRSYRVLFPALLTIGLCFFTSWATWTGYTAKQPVSAGASKSSTVSSKSADKKSLNLDKKYGRFPLGFEANRGQVDAASLFIARGPGYNISFRNDKAVLSFTGSGTKPGDDDQSESAEGDLATNIDRLKRKALRDTGSLAQQTNTVLTMKFVGANRQASAIEGIDELDGKVNYFLGNDSSKWLTDVPTYSKVAYREIYSGVDLIFYGNRQELEYDLVVAPQADLGAIQLSFEGAENIRVDRDGNLRLKTTAGELKQIKPAVYQNIDGSQKAVSGKYVVKPGNTIGFKVSKYDRSKPLIIDPILSYLSLVNAGGEGFATTADAAGNAYITGYVPDASLNATPGVFQGFTGGGADCFVTKINPAGTDVMFTTYLGGGAFDDGNSIAVDSSSNVYIGGACSTNFPITAGTYQTVPGGRMDGYIAKLNPTGNSLLFSTFFGGNGDEEVDTILVEPGTGNLLISGITGSTNLNTTAGAFRSSNTGGNDCFVAKLNPNASSALFVTYAGSNGFDYPMNMAADAAGNVYLSGQTAGLNFPTLNPVQATLGGASRGPFKSNNGGANWTSNKGTLQNTWVYSSAINPTTPSTMYLGTDGGVYKTTDGGTTWNATAPLPVTRVSQITLVPGSPNIIYIGTESGVFRSIDGGATWVARNNGLNPGLDAPDVRGIAIPQSAPNTIYAVSSVGAHKSTDGGGTWVAINSGIPNPGTNSLTNAIVVDPTNANILYVAMAFSPRLFKTINGGTSWTAANTGLAGSAIRALAINPTTPSTLYAANAVGIYKTINSGGNWAAANTGLTLTLSDSSTVSNPAMGFVTVDPQNPNTVYAGATAVLAGTGVASVTTVFKSTDSAGTWTAQSNGFGGINATISTIMVDPTNSSNVYANTLGDADAFLMKLDSAGASEIFGTYLGSARIDSAPGVVVDGGGNAYIAGGAGAAGFPTTGGAFQTTLKGSQDLFVAKFSGAGALSYSTLIGGNELDSTGGGIAVDSSGSVFATGFTFANDFPTTPGAFQRTIGNPGSRASDVFITKVNATGTGLDYSSYLGGDGSDYFNGFVGDRLALDAAENTYVVGVTASTNFPYFEWANQGGAAAIHTFVAKITTATPTFSITGRVTNSLNAGVAGIFVEADNANGGAASSGTTDANGYYAIINLKPGDYVVTPERYAAGNGNHYTYAPASRSFPGLNTDQTANFVATQTFDIQGTITNTNLSNLPIFDVTVNLTGTSSASVVTDVYGNFFLRDLLPGNYTVTPSKSGFTFNPVNRVFNSLSSDQFTSFTTTTGTYVTVSGRAADGSNAAIANATIAMQVAPQIGTRETVTQTDANGNYSVTNLQTGGNYSFVAIKPLIKFAPQQQNYTPLNSNQTLNFTGSAVTGLVGKIAFVRSEASEDIAVINADGTAETIVTSTNDCSGDSGPAWSPDGSRLAFSRCNNSTDPNDDLYLVNADGSGLTALQTDPERAETFPAWAPDGTRLTYTFGECSGTDGLIPEIFAIDATGALRTQLTSNSVTDAGPDWSPNGSSILFTRGVNSSCSGTDISGDLYTIDAVGGNERRLTNTPDLEFFGTYSPDGSKIAYVRSNQNLITNTFNDNIVVMNADGSSPTQITPNVISAERPTWSPDGTRIAFSGFIRGGTTPTQIFVVNVDGTGLAEITSNPSIGRSAPAWQHFSISGKVTGNTNGLPVTMTLAGTLTRVAKTDAAGNYIFGNLTPGGNYTVTPTSTSFTFTPAKIDVNNLLGNQIANFSVVPAAIPAPSPPLADNFAAANRDPDKWNLGTQTQPLGAFDPQVTVVQQSGQLIVTPRSQADGLHYNGYVAVNSFDFNSAKATVELVQPAINGAETIFAIGSDLDNYSRFVVRAGGGGSAPGKGRGPKGIGVPQLIFQVRVGGNLTSISIPYDPVVHRFMRFRHEPPTNSIVFETSPDNVNFTVRHSVLLQKSVSALTAELSAGTSTATNPGTAVFDNFNLVTNTFQFAVTAVSANENANRAIVTVTRSGDTSTVASVDYSTFDDTARQRTRYVPAVGTLSFAAGETSRTFSVLLEDNALVEGSQALSLRLIDSSGGGLTSPGKAVLTVDDNDTPPITTNPIDTAQFFVRQHYYDFLSRNPDPGGLNFWTGEITQCGSDQACINVKRIDVSNAFYFELEFQQTGSYVYRLYRVAFGNNQPFPNPRPDVNFPNEDKKLLSYNSFVSDRARVVGGAGLAQSQINLANLIIKRPEFIATYPLSLDGPGFVDAVLHKLQTDIGVDLNAQRAALISLFNSGGRGAVIYRLADDNVNTNPINNRPFIDAEYNRAFVATQYFGYLRRNADIAGFIFWLGQVNSGPLRDVNKQHAMVCSFVTSTEYQERFSLTVTHSNAECPH